MDKSRRAFLGTGMAAAAAAHAPKAFANGTEETFVDIVRPPDFVAAYVEGPGPVTLTRSAERWQAGDLEVTTHTKQGRSLAISVASPRSLLQRLHLRWRGRLPEGSRFLGDHWERSYSDLEWTSFVADRVMPWYVLVATGRATHGYGVKTAASAFCFWQADAEGISLWLDVRNGGSGVRPGIWVRPLLTVDPRAKGWELVGDRKPQRGGSPLIIRPCGCYRGRKKLAPGSPRRRSANPAGSGAAGLDGNNHSRAVAFRRKACALHLVWKGGRRLLPHVKLGGLSALSPLTRLRPSRSIQTGCHIEF